MNRTKKEQKPKAKDAKEVAEVKVSAPAKMQTASKGAMRVVVKPLVTEKAAHMQSARTYSFVVANFANKIEIAKAIKELYGVEPVAVRVINMQGKSVRFGKGFGKKSDFKKAMVTLKPGDAITIHEGV